MIDPVPVGYIELNQAVLRRAADISDREYQERMHEQMRRFRSLVQKENEQSQNEAEIEHENHNTDPATLLWGKRELAINDLYAALSDGS